MSHTCNYRSTMRDIHPMLSVTSVTFFFCGWCEVSFISNKQKNNRAKCYRWSESGPKNVPRLKRWWTYLNMHRRCHAVTYVST